MFNLHRQRRGKPLEDQEQTKEKVSRKPIKPGTRFGSCVILRQVQTPPGKIHRHYEYQCDCGTIGVRQSNLLKLKNSCGCLKGNKKHGHTAAGKQSLTYQTWRSVRGRCSGNGIKICKQWEDFEVFLADMGKRPGPEYSLKRIDNSRRYFPDNCYWAPISRRRKALIFP